MSTYGKGKIETYRGEVVNGQAIDLPCADWVTGFEVLTPDPMMFFTIEDINDTIIAILPHITTLPDPDPITGSRTYHCGPHLNRSGACPLRMRVHTHRVDPVALIVVENVITEYGG